MNLSLNCSRLGELFRRGRLPPWAEQYVAHWLKNPVKGSNFDRKTKYVRWLHPKLLIPAMLAAGYDGFLACSQDNAVRAHLFYQRHGREFHFFHVWVDAPLRERGLGSAMVRNFVEHGRSLPKIQRLRLSAGGDESVIKIVEGLRRHRDAAGIAIDTQFFATFDHRNVAPISLKVR